MKVITVKDSKEGSQIAFDIIKEALKKKQLHTLGLASGSSPEGLYQLMSDSKLDFGDVVTINLDEYVGVEPSDPHSYHYYMQEHLFDKVKFKASYLPDGMSHDLDAQCFDYDQIIKNNPIDIQILGIGENGHIAFDEPGCDFSAQTHLVDLTNSTIKANQRFFEHGLDVPKQAISMGIKSILEAKKIILLAWGPNKADAIDKLVNGPVTTDVPASALQNHQDVTLIVDEQAGSKIKDGSL